MYFNIRGDGALGFWKALSKVYPQTRHQRCWVHKTANVLNKLPKSVQPKVKEALHNIWMDGVKFVNGEKIKPDTNKEVNNDNRILA